jgi:hypothetical protein
VVERGDPGYDDLERPLLSITGGRFPIRSIFAFKVIEVAGVIAPSYLLFPETTEESQVDAAMNTYGVTSKRDRPL